MPRLGMIAILAPALLAASSGANHASFVVVSESGVDAYAEAVDGVGAVLSPSNVRLVDAGGKTFDRDLAAALEGSEPRVVIAIGSRALAEVRARHLATPLVAALVLHAGEAESTVRRIDLEVPLAAQFAAIKTLLPGKTRAGIIRNPGQTRVNADALEACARKEGFAPHIVPCEGPAQLLKALSALQGKVDFVLCMPDPDLYNAVTIKPLVMASLEHRLPLVGFSPSFVRAGAAAGIFPDYRDLGRQAAEMAQHLLRGEERTADESPRKLQVAINQRVARLLGVDFRGDTLAAEVYR